MTYFLFPLFLDVVYIGTIHPYHLTTGNLFMKSRKNVLIEKPLAMNSREVLELITAAQDNGVFLMEVTTVYVFKIKFTIHRLRSDHSMSPCRQFGHVSFPRPSKWRDC